MTTLAATLHSLADAIDATSDDVTSIRVEQTLTGREIQTTIWAGTRTAFEALARHHGLKTSELTALRGHRRWYAPAGAIEGVPLLIHGVSFPHHDDWEDR